MVVAGGEGEDDVGQEEEVDEGGEGAPRRRRGVPALGARAHVPERDLDREHHADRQHERGADGLPRGAEARVRVDDEAAVLGGLHLPLERLLARAEELLHRVLGDVHRLRVARRRRVPLALQPRARGLHRVQHRVARVCHPVLDALAARPPAPREGGGAAEARRRAAVRGRRCPRPPALHRRAPALYAPAVGAARHHAGRAARRGGRRHRAGRVRASARRSATRSRRGADEELVAWAASC